MCSVVFVSSYDSDICTSYQIEVHPVGGTLIPGLCFLYTAVQTLVVTNVFSILFPEVALFIFYMTSPFLCNISQMCVCVCACVRVYGVCMIHRDATAIDFSIKLQT